MPVTLKVKANPTRTYPQRGDNVNYGTQATLWAQDVTAAVNAQGSQFDWVLGSAAQVTAGTANFSDLATLVADAAVLDGHSVLVLTNTYSLASAAIINKRLTIICQSTDCIFESAAGIAAGEIIQFAANGLFWLGGTIKKTAGTPDYGAKINATGVFLTCAFTGAFAVSNLTFTSGEASFMGITSDGTSSDIYGRWGLGSNAAQTIMRFFGSDGNGTGGDNSSGLRSNNGVVQFKDRGGNWTGFAAVVGANTALSNLGATAVNDAIIPDADSARDLGTNLIRWANIYCDNYEGDTVVGSTSGDFGNIKISGNTVSSTGGTNTIIIPELDYDETAEVTITAHAGGGQALAYALTKHFNQISVCATNDDSVLLPAGFAVGHRITIADDGVADAMIWPAVGDNLGFGVDVPIQLLAGQVMTLEGQIADSTWRIV
ncbi:hypothetical protein GW915_11910 [bacterium]|nr:hypothetical protein [bacterium]